MSIEFKWQGHIRHQTRVFEPVEIGDDFRTVLEDKRGRKLVSNGRVAFEIISRGELYDQLLTRELKQRRAQAQATKTVVQKIEEKVAPVPRSRDITVPLPPVAVVEAVEATPVATPVTQVDEQVEAEQFLEEITERELYVPTANEWFEARIVKGSNPKILILELTTGDRVTCIPVFVTESPGSHVLCLPISTVGSVRIELYDGHYRALEFRVESEPSSLDETAQVFSWNTARNIGKAIRKCGCHIFIANILDESIYGTINNGDWIRYKLERSKSRTGWVGVSAQKIDAPLAQVRK